MATLYLRNVPPHVHEWLRTEAAKNGRTLEQQTTIILARGLGVPLSRKRMTARRKRRPPRAK